MRFFKKRPKCYVQKLIKCTKKNKIYKTGRCRGELLLRNSKTIPDVEDKCLSCEYLYKEEEKNVDNSRYLTLEKMVSDGYFVKRQYEIYARSNQQLNALEQVFRSIDGLCTMGASRELKIYIDGDGAMDIRIMSDGSNLEKNEDVGYARIDEKHYTYDLG